MLSDRLLFVDDDLIARKSFARAMRQRGFIVDVAKDAEEAWKLANTFPYAVVATDLELPLLDGMSLIEQLRELDPEPVCLLVTGAGDAGVEVDASRREISLVRKPWDSEELAAHLRVALGQYQARLAVENLEAAVPANDLSQHVLILDDTPAHAQRIEALLEADSRMSYRVSVAANLVDARRLLKRQDIAVCLASVGVEDLEIAALVEELKQPDAETAFILLGCDESREPLSSVVRAGAQDYVCESELDTIVLRRAIAYAIERKHAEKRLEFASRHDALTKLANRLLLQERLNLAINRARRKGTRVAVLFLDLDRFKAINDSLGHETGDELLTQVARRLYSSVRDTDIVARLSGDEFAIILEEVDGYGVITCLADRLLNSFATPFRLGEHEVVTTTSIGIALYPDNGINTDQVLKSAGTAVNRAKETGRNNYQFFGEDLHRHAMRRLQLESELRRGIAEERFVLHYQPQLDLATHRITGVEALLRWNRQGSPLVLPMEFVPLLEETGLIVPAGEWVLKRACADIERLHCLGFPDIRLSVNVSAVQFEDDDFVEFTRRVLNEWSLPPKLLELEITEGVLMRDSTRTQQALKDLEQLGVRVAVDDFGTGYCTLLTLKRFNIDTLKIDRSFVEDVTSSEEDASIAAAVIALGKSLSMEIVAEGVENVEQMAWLTARCCDSVQGHHVSPAVPFDELVRFMHARANTPSALRPAANSGAEPPSERSRAVAQHLRLVQRTSR